MVVIFVVVVVF